jgi:hypothetical protein
MRWRIPLVLILALFVAVSCDQQPTDPVEQPVATAPQFDFANGPPEVGVVTRSDYWELYIIGLFYDTPAEDWIIWMGLEPGEVPSWCVGDDKRPNAEAQQVGAKKGEKSNEVWKEDKVPVAVFDYEEHAGYFWEGYGLGEEPYCYAVTRATPIGGGEGNWRETAKYEGDSYEWHGHFNGTVDYMGETYRLQFKGKNPYSADEKNLVARVF